MENQNMSEFINDEIDVLDYPQVEKISEERGVSKATTFSSLEIIVLDSLSGKAIPHALVSLDTVSRTGKCDERGQVMFNMIPTGSIPVDVIVPGYIAGSVVATCNSGTHCVEIQMDRSKQLL